MTRVLQLTNKPVWPPVEGGPMAMAAMTKALLESGFEVKVLSVSTPKFPFVPVPENHPYLHKAHYETVDIDTRIKPWQAFLNLFSSRSYHIKRFFSQAFVHRLSEVLQEQRYDLVIMETVYLTPYLDAITHAAPGIPVILRAHNIEHLIWKRITSGEKNPLKRWYLGHLTNKLQREEIHCLNRFRAILPITGVDALWFQSFVPHCQVKAIPFGIRSNPDEPITPETISFPIKAYHLGSMDWYPNLEAVTWLLKSCWAQVESQLPEIELFLAGRNMPREILKQEMHGVHIMGEVPDAQEFIRDKHMLIAPIFSGSGIRIKILEAMAMGKVVLTTPVGAEGIEYTHGENILIFRDCRDLLNLLKALMSKPVEMPRIGGNARMLVEQFYNPEKLAVELKKFLQTVIS
ncbi:MAG: glycosyltransferase family 4 protein [Bacteroidales bacterium]